MLISRTSFLFTLLLGALAALPPLGIDMSLPGLPALASELGTTSAAAGATLSVFLLGFAIAPLLFGPVSDRFGRRPVLLAGVAVFAAAGYLCAGAPSIRWVLAGRLAQGMGAGVGAAMPLAIVRDLFQGTAARSRLSHVTVVLSVAPLVAPSIGSAILPFGGWRGIYLTLGLASSLVLFVVAFGFAESLDPARHQSLHPTHLMARYRRVLSHGTVVGFATVNGLSFACMFAFISGSPLVLIAGRGLGAPAFSAIFACAGFGTICGATLNGRLAKLGVRSSRVIICGLILGAAVTVAALTVSFTGCDGLTVLLPLLVLSNAAYGLVGPSATHEALLPMPEAAGTVSAVLRCIQMVAGAGASALVPLLHRGGSAIPMTMVMAACATSALLIYVVRVRRAPAIRTGAGVLARCVPVIARANERDTPTRGTAHTGIRSVCGPGTVGLPCPNVSLFAVAPRPSRTG